MLKILPINAKTTLELRQRLLRPHQTQDMCHYPGDDDELTAHFGLQQTNKLVGIVSIYNRHHNQLALMTNTSEYSPDHWQIRAMAIDPMVRGQGYGALLLKEAEQYAQLHNAKLIWANARKSAIEFYQKASYEITGEEFIIDQIGPHYLIFKKLCT